MCTEGIASKLTAQRDAKRRRVLASFTLGLIDLAVLFKTFAVLWEPSSADVLFPDSAWSSLSKIQGLRHLSLS